MLQFAHPWLFALVPLPWLVAISAPPFREKLVTVRVSFLDRIARISGQPSTHTEAVPARPRSQLIANTLLWLLLVAALARPQWIEEPLVFNQPMRDLLVAVDLSGSMDTIDFTNAAGDAVDRLSAVKEVMRDFLARRSDDRIGLIVFGSAAFVQVPFTDDTTVVQQLLDETAVRMAGPRTMFGDAIGLAITLFERSELEDRVLIALTDGNDTGSQVPPARAAEIARDQGIVIHTIGVGDPQAAGEEALDEVALQAVATVTGGRYFHAADRATLAEVYDEIDRLTPRKVDTLSYRPQRDLFHWPLGAALLLSLLYHGIAAAFASHRSREPHISPDDGNTA
ncbi:MAG: VWA domain-containing protein [Gammaproteobacteria bacterium]|jgi:Ca-activated chloride channel family protein